MESVPKERMMKFPYTLSAQMAAFPYKFYYKYAWFTKYYMYGILVTIPIFMKINTIVNSPENVEKWRKIREEQLKVHV